MSELFKAEKINEQIRRIHLPGDVCAYYLEGEEKGLLIDTGYGYGDLKAFIDSISSKPYEVAITHGHVDHAGGAVQFDRVYLNERDIPVGEIHTELSVRTDYFKKVFNDFQESELLPAKPMKNYISLKDDQEFDLGGLTVKFVALAGHTQGSMVALIPKYNMMVFGDALNSMTFLQLPESTTIEEYKNNLIQFKKLYHGVYDYVFLFLRIHLQNIIATMVLIRVAKMAGPMTAVGLTLPYCCR